MFEVRPAASIIHPDTIGLADRAIPLSLSLRRSVKFKSVFETISLSWIPFFKVVNPLWGIIIIPRDIKRVHGPLPIIHLIFTLTFNDEMIFGQVAACRIDRMAKVTDILGSREQHLYALVEIAKI